VSDDGADPAPVSQRTIADWARFLDGCQTGAHFDTLRRIQAAAPLYAFPPMDDEPPRPPQDVPTRAVALAFGYHIEEKRDGRRRRLTIEPFRMGSDNEQVPPPVASLPANIITVWAELVELVTAPFAVAQLAHLLYERRHGRPHDYALRASDAYLACAPLMEHLSDRAKEMSAALRLARAVGDADRSEQIQDAIVRFAEVTMDDPEDKPGIVLMLAKILADEPSPPAALDAVLAAARSRYDDVHSLDKIIRLQRERTTDVDALRVLDEDRVALWLDHANKATGIVRAAHLETAVRTAQRAQRPDLVATATALLQQVNPEDLQMAEFSASINMTREEVEEIIASIVEAPTWQEALDAFSIFGPPTGELDRNRKHAQELYRESIVEQLLPPKLIQEGLPRLAPTTPEERAEYRLTQFEEMQMQNLGRFVALALRRIIERHGLPTEAEFVEYLTKRPVVNPDLAAALARSLLRYWTGDYEAAAFTAAPRVETVARRLVQSLGVGVYRLQRQQTPGQYPGLAPLLETLLQHGMDPSWHRFVYTLCVNPMGPNFRNNISHGYINNMGEWPAALLLQAVFFLTALHPSSAEGSDRSPSE
jgi:hypothetical protein